MAHSALVDMVFSWSLEDMLNQNLYRKKVEKIPETFSSVSHYLNSFTYPLLEETHADVHASVKNVAHAPTCKVLYVAESADKNLRRSNIYDVQFEQEISQTGYKPQMGDLILLSDARSVRVGDMKRSTYITQQKRYDLYAVYLVNLTTNNRIWEALKQGTEGKGMNIIRNVLDAGSTVGEECNLCSSHVIGSDLHGELQSSDLNASQTDAVLRSILTSKCIHKNSVKLIWGPPGTGKTKTVASLLWALLNMKCRTLVCAPTNIAVVEIAMRLLKLAREEIKSDCYGLGDIVLFGNEVRMRLKEYDELSDIFLDYRVTTLGNCFTEWKGLVNSMIRLLKDPIPQYIACLENMKKMKEDERDNARKDKQMKGDLDDDNDDDNDDDDDEEEEITFQEYVSKKFKQIKNNLSICFGGLCNNVPSTCISEVVEDINKALALLESVETLLNGDIVSDDELTKIFAPHENTGGEYLPSLGILRTQRNECLKILIALASKISIPNLDDNNLIREYCLKNATLIFSTASSSANINLADMKPLKMLVVDEAAQLKECELLIPLQLPGIQHIILIGDDCQLPATIKSTISQEADFGRSLFERMVSLGQRKHLLNTQYRMNPSISLFPNKQFYNNQILDGANVREKAYKRILLKGDTYGPYSFINVAYGSEASNNKHSQKNMVEVAVVSKIVSNLYEASIVTGERVSVGVISPYNGQVFAIQEKIGDKYGKSTNFSVSVRSVDGFQGGEEDVIIISTVRSNEDGSLGFLTKSQRTNVALTRARYCLWIVGNGRTLTHNDSIWKELVNDAENRGCYFNADEDSSLAAAIIDGLLDSEQIEDINRMKSILFRHAKWKVIFGEAFFSSLKDVRSAEAREEVISMLKKLSNGWRDPEKERDLKVTEIGTSQLLKFYEVDKEHILVWTVDLLKENLQCIQVLKFWAISTCYEMPDLAKSLNHSFRKYTTEDIDRRKFKCLEGDLELPMCWEITPEEDREESNSNSLSARLASLYLK
ncbi:hypothetical protein Sjap_014625 [Stephania japonica]|uniref:Uncharacterized protein n=1 Tax=Stephania japonica TaxID=461633 RepID=A0AAP0IHQ7_9MAGN